MVCYYHTFDDIEAVSLSSTPAEFFEKLHTISKSDAAEVGSINFDTMLYAYMFNNTSDIRDYTEDVTNTIIRYADYHLARTSPKFLAKDLDELIDRMEAARQKQENDLLFLRNLCDAIKTPKSGCPYCIEKDGKFSVDVFKDPNSDMEIALSVGENKVQIGVRFADGRKGVLTTRGKYCPYCGRKIR